MHLVRADLHLMDAALRGDVVLAETLGCDVAAGWATFTEALKPTRDAVAASPDGGAWGARFFVTGEPPELVVFDREVPEEDHVVGRFRLARSGGD